LVSSCKADITLFGFGILSLTDLKELTNFKRRTHCQQKTFNTHLKKFCLAHYFTMAVVVRGDAEREEFFGIVIEAVYIIIQNQMENRRALFAI
jgi:hypothetical protein